ncbi:MAG: ABC transporter ATP-binding protein [Clostridia bacterium]|jgi:multiple sugar transport system ATP-binding protein|nr:ABC transporter ATP-binding protein [Clostridia bacterium]
MANLKVVNLNKKYPSGENGLINVNLEAQDKEFIVITGGDNSGKSTLLRVIAGLEEPSSGEVYIDGKDVTESEPKERDLAMVFKGGALYPALNVFENLAYGLRLRKAPEALIRERVNVVAEMLGLKELLTRKPKALSAAEKQRVAIGRAIVREPKLYLFDEPLSGLDEKLQAEMLGVIINLQARLSGTFVYCTKNVAEALTVGTRVIILKDGLVQQADTPANLYDYPANAFVGFCVGAPTMNFISNAKIVAADGGYKAVFKGGELPLSEKVAARFESIKEYAGCDSTVILGIRPEDAEICGDGVIKGVAVQGCDGHGGYTEIDVSPDICLNVTAKKGLEKGAEAGVSVDLDRLYIFDGITRLTLLARDGGYQVTGLPNADFVPLPFDEEQKLCGNAAAGKKNKK